MHAYNFHRTALYQDAVASATMLDETLLDTHKLAFGGASLQYLTHRAISTSSYA